MKGRSFYQLFHQVLIYVLLVTCIPVLSLAASCKNRLVFSANLDGNWDLFTLCEDGKDLVRLTETPYDEKEPCWSRDRTKVIFAASDGRLHLINVSDRKELQLATSGKGTPEFSPCFSPDDNKVAFVQFIPGTRDDTDLVILDIKKKEKRTLIHQYAAQFWPAWSPGGKKIAYINSHCSGDCGRLIQELWMADPRGGWARQILLTNSFCREPSWSPDGKRIAFSSDKGGNFDIWILDLNDWNLRQVTKFNGLDVSPAWSPDGNRIAFISTRSGIMEIWIKDMVSGDLRRLNPFGKKTVECKDVAW